MLRIVGEGEALGDADMMAEGANGPNVFQIQTILTGNGYPVGLIDGQFGPKTKQAVMHFQSSQGLTSDGIIGPQTWSALLKLQTNPSTAPQQVKLPKVAQKPVAVETPWSTYVPFIFLAGIIYLMATEK